MRLFGKNGIVRQQEIAFAKKLLVWKYENAGAALPDETVLRSMAEKVVADAHEIAQKRGRNVLEILKTQAMDLKNSITDKEKKK
jgi:hypothetical protein